MTYERGVEVRQIEIDVWVLRALHAAEDGLGDHVARGKLGAGVFGEHEANTVLVAEIGALAADGLTDEIAAGAGHVEDGGVELHELHVAQLGAGAVSSGHAVAGGYGRVGRLAIDHAGAARGENRLLGPDQELVAPRPVHEGADAVPLMRQQVDGEGLVPESDVRDLAGAVDDGPHHFMTGGVAQGMDDAAVAVTALARQRDLAALLVEVGAPMDQVGDLLRGLAHDQFDDVAVTETCAGGDRVLDVIFKAVLGRHDAGDAALGITAVALLDVILGHHQDAQLGRRLQGGAQAGDARTDDEDVCEKMRGLLRTEGRQVAGGRRLVAAPTSYRRPVPGRRSAW